MLKISRLSDYAVLIVVHMAKNKENCYNATQISESTKLNIPTVRKILNLLTANKIMSSRRGVDGGYYFNRPVCDIEVLTIIEAIEGKVAVTECCVVNYNVDCAVVDCCTSQHWQIINSKIKLLLMQITIKNILNNENFLNHKIKAIGHEK